MDQRLEIYVNIRLVLCTRIVYKYLNAVHVGQIGVVAHVTYVMDVAFVSKGGVLAYTKNVAMRVARFGATCNSLDPGGVLTPLNECVMNDPELWAEIMDETPLKRWATPEEIAEWAYFLTVVNGFCTGQSILVDGGESINYNFVWKN